MSDLRTAIDRALADLNPAPLATLGTCHVRQVLDRLAHREPREPPPPTDPEKVRRSLLHAHRTGDWSAVRLRDDRYAPLFFWTEPEPLVREPGFLEAYFRRLRSLRRPNAIHAVARAYLEAFARQRPGLAEVASFLEIETRTLARQWAEQLRAWKAFDPERSPAHLARLVMTKNAAPREVLRQAGLPDRALGRGLAEAAFGHELGRLQHRLKTGAPEHRLSRVLQWATIGEDGSLAYKAAKPRLAAALLLPWVDRSPADEMRTRIQSFLLNHLGDPRLDPKEWQGVEEPATQILFRWLAGASLRQFLDIIDHYALDHQWKYRRAFWTAYYRRHVIRDAWVVLGKDCRRQARIMARTTEDPSWQNHAVFARGSGAAARQAVLLMRIGDLTIADWSHNGACRIWSRNRQQKPQLYRKTYHKTDINVDADVDLNVWHMGAPQYRWQNEIADYIKKHTGIAMKQSEYKVII